MEGDPEFGTKDWKKDREPAIDQEIAAFERWFLGKTGGQLHSMERMILKSYLDQKVTGTL